MMSLNPKPLNPKLYEVLRRLFGRVKICNAGVSQLPARWIANATLRLRSIQSSEYYMVAPCWFCEDMGHPLCMSHLFCTLDPRTGRRNSWAVWCSCSDAPMDPEDCLDLAGRLRQRMEPLKNMPAEPEPVDQPIFPEGWDLDPQREVHRDLLPDRRLEPAPLPDSHNPEDLPWEEVRDLLGTGFVPGKRRRKPR